MISVDELALMLLWIQRSGMGRGNVVQQWEVLGEAERELWRMKARKLMDE